MRYIISLMGFGYSPGSPPSLACPENLHQKISMGRHPGEMLTRCPNHLSCHSFWNGFEISLDVWVHHPVCCWAQPPFRKNSFRRLVFRALISGSQGSNADGSVAFFTTTVWNHSFITTDASPVCQLNSRSTFSLLVHKIPRCYDSFS